jgi:hypothetical protein
MNATQPALRELSDPGAVRLIPAVSRESARHVPAQPHCFTAGG